MKNISPKQIEQFIEEALLEDVKEGDFLTSSPLVCEFDREYSSWRVIREIKPLKNKIEMVSVNVRTNPNLALNCGILLSTSPKIDVSIEERQLELTL